MSRTFFLESSPSLRRTLCLGSLVGSLLLTACPDTDQPTPPPTPSPTASVATGTPVTETPAAVTPTTDVDTETPATDTPGSSTPTPSLPPDVTETPWVSPTPVGPTPPPTPSPTPTLEPELTPSLPPVTPTAVPTDVDQDGYSVEGGDCDDQDPSRSPGALEACDGVDNDCDGLTDEADASDASSWFLDGDGDGYGAGEPTVSCQAGEGYVAEGGDCDDGDVRYHPGAEESDCGDPADYNCDGSTGYLDGDGDGSPACHDCDDSRAEVKPGAAEQCDGLDNDCDGEVDATAGEPPADASSWYQDADMDGFGSGEAVVACEAPTGYGELPGDCDDDASSVSPAATERCDGLDNDCDGAVDAQGAPAQPPADAAWWYQDADGDGAGGSVAVQACQRPDGYVSTSSDCDDQEAQSHPGAVETCDGLDNDCDGATDEAAEDGTAPEGASSWYQDLDADGYGDPGVSSLACTAPSGYVARGDDCQDGDSRFHPGAEEADCTDPADYNCDGMVAYADADGDGVAACQDCNDTSAEQAPGLTEVCDGLDNDCDGSVDEGDASDALPYYVDEDGDGAGGASSMTACAQPVGYVDNSLDCDDQDGEAFPGHEEVCDGVDNDCNQEVDEPEAVDAATWYADVDGDGYGTDLSAPLSACQQPPTTSAVPGDCNDLDSKVNPAAKEVCDSIDNDCDGLLDGQETSLRATFSLTVPATANLWGAGHATPPAPLGGGAGTLPVLVNLPDFGPERTVRVLAATGQINYGPGPNGADGITVTSACTMVSYGGIAGYTTVVGRCLSGVFLSGQEPQDPAPTPLNLSSGPGFLEVSPLVAQSTFVGDGMTGTGSGNTQRFNAPTNATRFYLGFFDTSTCGAQPGLYGDNSGSLSVALEVSCKIR